MLRVEHSADVQEPACPRRPRLPEPLGRKIILKPDAQVTLATDAQSLAIFIRWASSTTE